MFSGTISGSTFILRSLFTIVLSIPFIVIVFAMLGTIVFSYMDIDLAAADGMSMAESNAIGEAVSYTHLTLPTILLV